MESNNKANKEDCTACTVLCCGCIGVLAIIGCAVSYIVFGIMFLVQDYTIAHECENSALWAYVLTAIILSLSRSGAKNTKDDQNRVMTPTDALKNGANQLVIGRSITKSKDPQKIFSEICKSIA